jgi:hypothetical protein
MLLNGYVPLVRGSGRSMRPVTNGSAVQFIPLVSP